MAFDRVDDTVEVCGLGNHIEAVGRKQVDDAGAQQAGVVGDDRPSRRRFRRPPPMRPGTRIARLVRAVHVDVAGGVEHDVATTPKEMLDDVGHEDLARPAASQS